ncbi:MAG TPA: patatin-like phospholipase family protein [Actinomycetota bacterium]|nr:patatin-like phospholipase family protein [Actinomycetota bacterium]
MAGAPGAQEQLRICVSFSGGASLGAYEAGAFAALLTGVRRLQRDLPGAVVVDAVGGASAGSLVALLGAYAQLQGLDPLDFLHEAWVERVNLDLMRRKAGEGLLSFDRLRQDIIDFLWSNDRHSNQAQSSPLGLHVALTGLQGLTYKVSSLGGTTSFSAVTYSDWGRFMLEAGAGPQQILEPEGTAPLDYVLASASHPGAFRPTLLDRSADKSVYAALGIDNFPSSQQLWYTDGGLGQSNPLGRLLSTARWIDEQTGDKRPYKRALVLIDPRSEDPSGALSWGDPENSPKWLHGLSRALEIVPAQVVYDDALRLEKANARLAWAQALTETLAPQLSDAATMALRDFLHEVDADKAGSPKERVHTSSVGAEAASAQELLTKAIEAVSGLGAKEIVDLNVITPRQLTEDDEDEVPRLLAGEFFGDFGGFLQRDIRRSDFLLGYASIEAWLPEGLADTGYDPGALELMSAEVTARSPGDWRKANMGAAGPSSLPWPSRLRLGRLLVDAARAVAANVVDLTEMREKLSQRASHLRRGR